MTTWVESVPLGYKIRFLKWYNFSRNLCGLAEGFEVKGQEHSVQAEKSSLWFETSPKSLVQ